MLLPRLVAPRARRPPHGRWRRRGPRLASLPVARVARPPAVRFDARSLRTASRFLNRCRAPASSRNTDLTSHTRRFRLQQPRSCLPTRTAYIAPVVRRRAQPMSACRVGPSRRAAESHPQPQAREPPDRCLKNKFDLHYYPHTSRVTRSQPHTGAKESSTRLPGG